MVYKYEKVVCMETLIDKLELGHSIGTLAGHAVAVPGEGEGEGGTGTECTHLLPTVSLPSKRKLIT